MATAASEAAAAPMAPKGGISTRHRSAASTTSASTCSAARRGSPRAISTPQADISNTPKSPKRSTSNDWYTAPPAYSAP